MFNQGDLVKRTADNYGCMEKGTIYEVENCSSDGTTLRHMPGIYLTSGFELVSHAVKQMVLPSDATERKRLPITTGVLDYFPLAMAAVAQVSKAGNDQHNPGQPLHWARGKSIDHHDCIARHLIDRGTMDTDGQRHSAKLAWRALAALQVELEQERGLFLDAK